MFQRYLRESFAVAAIAALLALVVRAQDRPTRREADLMRQKVTAISKFAGEPRRAPHRTAISETEVNAYLTFDAVQDLPAGVVDPSMTMLGTGRVAGRAVVDLDAVQKPKIRRACSISMSYLTGRVPLTATGVLRTSNGVGQFALESATVGGLPIPKTVLQEIVSYYSRTPQNPSGISLDDSFALPARIREIQVERGQAIVLQ